MYRPTIDLAGEVCFCPNFWQTKTRINYLIEQYLDLDSITDLLDDLSKQFQPQPRQWLAIDWQDITPEQVIGIELDFFLSAIECALDTEASITNYSQTSWQYQENPYHDYISLGLHRVANEYSMVCWYIWLMSHTTGTTQQILSQLLEDKIYCLAKFLAMEMWLDPDGAEQSIQYLLSQINTILPVSYESNLRTQSNLKSNFQHMMSILNWQSRSIISRGELIYTFMGTLEKIWHWSSQLTPEYLQSWHAQFQTSGKQQPEILST